MIEPELSLTFKKNYFLRPTSYRFAGQWYRRKCKIRVYVGVKAFDRKQKRVHSK